MIDDPGDKNWETWKICESGHFFHKECTFSINLMLILADEEIVDNPLIMPLCVRLKLQ